MKNKCTNCGDDLETCENCNAQECPTCGNLQGWQMNGEGLWFCPECAKAYNNMPMIYLSGPISDPETRMAAAASRIIFEAAEIAFDTVGHFMPINPRDNGLSDDDPWIDHIIRDLELLKPCEAVYMLAGWQESPGARIEHEAATRERKAIYYAEQTPIEHIKPLPR